MEQPRPKNNNFADISNRTNFFQSPNPKQFNPNPFMRVKDEFRNKSQSFRNSPQKKVSLSKGSNFVGRQSVNTHQINSFTSKIKPSKVVLVSNMDNIFQSAREVFNLFSCFGNIKKVLLMKNLNKALVEYEEA